MRDDSKIIEGVYEDILVKLLQVLYTEDIESGPSDKLIDLQKALLELKEQRDRNNWDYDLEIIVKLK